ncbi:hypothetical protein DXG01_012434 [Tephrocybe rancida]|nr:hypothetical protein DXG01_012434 [Tephrocybe rancida]
MDIPTGVNTWGWSQFFDKSLSLGTNCSQAYSQSFNFTTASKTFELGVPNRIWWDAGTTKGNITFHVTTLGPQSNVNGSYWTLTLRLAVSNITEKEGQGIGFDWTPSIAPDAPFVITLGDDRGIGSGGSLHGSISPFSFLCAYQLSGSYSVLQRVILYVLFLFGTIGIFTASSWMTGAFLGGAMAFSGSAAIHSIILTASSKKAIQKGTIDLDGIAIFQILSTCLYLCAPLLTAMFFVRKRTGEGPAKAIIVCVWAVLIVAGFFCCFGNLPAPIPPCAPYNMTTSLGTSLTVATSTSRCAEWCLTKSSIVRSVGEARMTDSRITTKNIFGPVYAVGLFLGSACALWILAITVATFVAPNKPLDILSSYLMALLGFSTYTSMVVFGGVPVILFVQIFYGEYLLATQTALVGEKSYAIGQWGPWVIVGLATVAAIFLAAAKDGVLSSTHPEHLEPDQPSDRESTS